MKLNKPFGNRTVAAGGVSLAIATFAVHGWNRLSHGVLSSPAASESNPPLLIFIITLLMIYIVPLALSLFAREAGADRGWPTRELIGVLIWIFLSLMFLFIPDLIGGEYQDAVGGLLLYAAVILAYSFAIKKGIANWPVRNWGKSVANVGVVLISAFLIFIISWAMLYLE